MVSRSKRSRDASDSELDDLIGAFSKGTEMERTVRRAPKRSAVSKREEQVRIQKEKERLEREEKQLEKEMKEWEREQKRIAKHKHEEDMDEITEMMDAAMFHKIKKRSGKGRKSVRRSIHRKKRSGSRRSGHRKSYRKSKVRRSKKLSRKRISRKKKNSHRK
jgi:hypothetical protein